jgi:hypothetical protein
MEVLRLLGHSMFLIFINIAVCSSIISDSYRYKGMIVEGEVKYMFITFMAICAFYFYIESFYVKRYNSYIKNTIIYKEYLKSPLFFTWAVMYLYIFKADIVFLFVKSFNQFVFIYVLLCLLLILFQNGILVKFEKIKKQMSDKDNNPITFKNDI